MKRTLIALAAVLLAGLTFETPAVEAGGVRLGFGGPLPSFTARPSGRHAYSKGHSRAYQAARICKNKKKTSSAVARASRPSPRVKVARAQTIKQKLREKAVASTVKTKAREPEEAPTEEVETTVTETDPVTAPEDEAAAPVETTAATATGATDESAAEVPPVPAKKPDCKKFVPSVGLTITVPCI